MAKNTAVAAALAGFAALTLSASVGLASRGGDDESGTTTSGTTTSGTTSSKTTTSGSTTSGSTTSGSTTSTKNAPGGSNTPAMPASGPTSFADATARFGKNVKIGNGSYVGPFADLKTSDTTSIRIGNGSNAQDSTLIDARLKSVLIGDMAILAHGSSARNGASIGVEGTCPPAPAKCASFVSFNAVVDGGTLQKDAMVGALARVGPGVVIPSGKKVLPGRNVTSQEEVGKKTADVTELDREFMEGVLEVNAAFASEYPALLADDEKAGTGINFDPGNSDFNPDRDLPTLDGEKVQAPKFRNRIIGDVQLEQSIDELDDVMDDKISLRADEGEPFHIGTIKKMESRTTFHALEDSHIETGNRGRYGFRSIVHGGPNDLGGEENLTKTGNNVRIGDGALFFNSHMGRNSRMGDRSIVQASELPAGTQVPPRAIMVGGVQVGTVEW